MFCHCRSKHSRPMLETLEGRAMLSGMGTPAGHGLKAAIRALEHKADITINPAGESALLTAINGGAGHEFVTLIRKEIPNLNSVILGFVTGRITVKSIPGFVAQVSKANPLYTGPGLDRMFLTEVGGIVLKGGVIELGAIMRGPFYSNSATTSVTFALNRGEGSSLGPAFASEPGVTPDLKVTITVGPYGQSYSGTITDLTSGATQSISSSDIEVKGPVVRVLLSPSQVPSKGFSPKNYKFSAWTNVEQFDGVSYTPGIASVGSFAPSTGTMDKIGVLSNVKPPVL